MCTQLTFFETDSGEVLGFGLGRCVHKWTRWCRCGEGCIYGTQYLWMHSLKCVQTTALVKVQAFMRDGAIISRCTCYTGNIVMYSFAWTDYLSGLKHLQSRESVCRQLFTHRTAYNWLIWPERSSKQDTRRQNVCSNYSRWRSNCLGA